MSEASTEKLLKILEASPEQRLAAVETLSGITPLLVPKELERVTAEGYLEAFLVESAGRNIYCVWCHITIDRGLHINAVAQMTAGADFGELVVACELYAEQHSCNYIRFNTRRPGLVAKAEAFGYHPESLCLVKKL